MKTDMPDFVYAAVSLDDYDGTGWDVQLKASLNHRPPPQTAWTTEIARRHEKLSRGQKCHSVTPAV